MILKPFLRALPLRALAAALSLGCMSVLAENAPEASGHTWSDDEGEIVILKAPYLDIHTAPGRGYPIFHATEKNEKLRIFKRRGDWFKVETDDGKLGWVHRDQLTQLVDNQGQLLDFRNPGWRDANSNPWQLGLLVGNTDGAITYTTLLGYRFTENMSTELRYTQAFGNFSNLKMAGLNIVHQPFPHLRYSPFFTLGSGSIKTSPNAVIIEAEDRQDSYVSVGTGLIFHASARIDLRAEYIKDTVLTSRETNEEIEEWKAGFSLLF